MKISTKLLILMGIAVVALLVATQFVGRAIGVLSDRALHEMVANKKADLDACVAVASHGALEQAVAFAGHPAVIAALEQASSGNLEDENDPVGQQAREQLRRDLGPVLERFEKVQGRRLKLHVHLPGVRSLARLWRDKQAKRDGAWVDVSDDLSSFRETIRDVQTKGEPVSGIELGRGGFTVRGLAPVFAQGKVIGSVEVLESFEPILGLGSDELEKRMLFMNADRLAITTKLDDRDKYPHIGADFVQVVAPAGESAAPALTRLLASGKASVVMEVDRDTLFAAFPVNDYQGRQIGVLGLERDVSALTAPARASIRTLWMAAFVLALVLGGFGFWTLQRTVVVPAKEMSAGLDVIANGGDLGLRLDDARNDELGACAKGFNKVVARVATLAEASSKLANHLLGLPYPVVELDGEQRIVFANRAALAQAGAAEGQLDGRAWSQVFRAQRKDRAGVVSKVVQTKVAHTDEGYVGSARGDVRAQLTAMPIDSSGGYLVSWMDLEQVYGVVTDVRSNAGQIGNASSALRTTSEWIAETATVLQSQARGVSGATQELTKHLADASVSVDDMSAQATAVAAAMKQLDASLADVAKNTAETAQVARDVDDRSQGASNSMGALEESLASIGSVVEVIEDVADRVSLLALNAKIEASSAGEAGLGFGVVADEVKELARQTSGATEQIRARIADIRSRSDDAVAQTRAIREAADDLRRLSESVAAAVEEQSATLSEVSGAVRGSADAVELMSRRVKDASSAAEELSSSAEVVDQSARTSADRASQTQTDAASLAGFAAELQSAVERFHLQ